ncbi:MAG: cysteine--tRNA ligase [Gammaproteobacteria bacterium]
MLQIQNSLSGKKEVFKPLCEGKVGIYVCGMTVYDYCHLGHARVMVVFDVVTRYLRHSGYQVTYVRNITDIDDKIIQRARENNEEINDLTTRFIDAMHEDATELGVLAPDIEPRATRSISQILDMIRNLVDNGFAYAADNGDVYYDVSRFEGYGKLSGRSLEDMQAGSRVEVDEAKDDPMDFVLWKASKPGEPAWESPWGKGRPGWHIECSAMSTNCLGDHFDIHGGGMDLMFPHHENEIAQSEASTGHQFVNTWMHNGFVQINEEKMSKSLGNFFTVRAVLKKYPAEVIRYFIVASHYRSPLHYSSVNLDSAKAALDRFYGALRGLDLVKRSSDESCSYQEHFQSAMNDDFNTPEALAVLFSMVSEINRFRQSEDLDSAAALAAELRELASTLGILQSDPEDWFKKINIAIPAARLDLKAGSPVADLSDNAIDELIAKRNQARADKDFAEADRIRDELKHLGVILEDGPGGTTWRRG